MQLRLFTEDHQTQKAFGRLGAFAFYSGVGAKTPYGMGMALISGRYVSTQGGINRQASRNSFSIC